MRNHKLKILSMTLLLLSGCSNTGNSGGTGAVPTAEEAVTLENPVRLDQLGVLPATNSSAASYLLQLTNYSKEKYTLDSVRIIDLDTGKDSELVSVASQACSTVSANGSCSIQLTPHTTQSADVKLEVMLKDKLAASTKLVQLVRVSGELNAHNGGIVMLNDVDRIVTEDGNYSLSIPVVLGDSYDDIKASNGNLLCNTTGYQKGSSCTYQVSGKVAGTSAVVSTRLEGIKAGKTATVQEANTKVEVAKGAHILLSHGTKINDPMTSNEITVFNSGNTPATNIIPTVEASSGLKIENLCDETLEANASCKVKASVISTTNGQGSVKVAYTDGTTANTAQTNVRYKVAEATAGVVFTESSNNLANAIVSGKPREALVSIKNTGNRRLEGISYYLAPAGSNGLILVKPAINGCDLGGGAELKVNESCNLSVKYTPAAAQASNSINLMINSKYTDQNGQSHALVSAQGLAYSATKAGSGNLTWRVTTGNGNLSIINDGSNVESATWELKNTLAADENLPAIQVSVTLNPSTINGLTVDSTDAATCPLTNANIAGNSACQYKVSYGPTRVELAQTDVDLKAAYNFYSGVVESSSAKFKVASSAALQPKIKVDVAISGATVTGDGTQALPWNFTAYHDKTISLKYTFTNIGTLKADKFNLDTGNLPKGAVLNDTTCPNGVIESDLALGVACIANIDIPDPKLFSVPNLVNGNLNSASLKLDLPYSYSYNSNLYRGNSDAKYVNFKRLWANVIHTTQAASSTESAYEFDVLSKVSAVEPSLTTSYPITVTPTLKSPIPGVTLTSCTIANASDESCINKILLPKNMFIPGEELLVTFKTIANGLDPKNAIVSDYSVGAIRKVIHDEVELIDAFKGDTSGKTFVLESDIKLSQPWIPVPSLTNATFDGQGHKITNLVVSVSSGINSNGMFRALSGNVVIKNLSIQGSIEPTDGTNGILAGNIAQYANVKLLNSNFNSIISGISADRNGGVIGFINGDTIIESVTVISEVSGKNQVGGLSGAANASVKWKNIHIKSKVHGTERVGGLSGSLYVSDSFIAENIVANTTVNVESGGSQIGGLFAATRGIKMSNIDVVVNITGGSATQVGGLVGNLSWQADKDKLSNIIVRGAISTLLDPRATTNKIAGIGSALSKVEVNKIIDLTTIAYTNGTTTTNYISPLSSRDFNVYENSGNVYYVLPANATYIAAANPGWVSELMGITAVDQKAFLENKGRGFDFTNTWTIKKINGVDSIGIKEDSIPQFPQW